MTLKQLFVFLLQFIFVFIFSSCTSSGNFNEEIFQAEEEEYMESKGSRVADLDEEEEDYEESDVLEDSGIIENEVSMEDETTDDFDPVPVESSDNFVNVETPKKTWVPLKKIPTQPWRQDGKWVNAVYIARSEEDLSQISVKIYGHTQLVDELKNFNPFLKRRDPKVGDKIYYNSPNRPKDRVKFSHYYEDNNQTASTYDIQAGENIRTVSSNLLGHKDSWKEIWATNPQIESKGNVNETVTLYYWPGSRAVVEGEQPPSAPEQAAGPDLSSDATAEKEEKAVQEDSMIEEPPTLDGGGDEESSALIEEEVLQPPEASPSSDIIEGESEADSFISKNANKIKVIAIAGILLILAVFFIRMIRNRKNRSDFDFSQTHIDIDNIEE